MKYVWLTNVLNPEGQLLDTSLNYSDQTFEPNYSLLLQWLSQKAIGEPKSTDSDSIEQLRTQGYVGVYKLV